MGGEAGGVHSVHDRGIDARHREADHSVARGPSLGWDAGRAEGHPGDATRGGAQGKTHKKREIEAAAHYYCAVLGRWYLEIRAHDVSFKPGPQVK